MLFFQFHLSGRKDDFSHNPAELREHWQPRGQSPGTSLAKSGPQASSTQQLCREAHPLHHCPGQKQSLALVWLIVFGTNDRSARREGRNAASSVSATILIFLFYLLLICSWLHNFFRPLLFFFGTLAFLSSSCFCFFFLLCAQPFCDGDFFLLYNLIYSFCSGPCAFIPCSP